MYLENESLKKRNNFVLWSFLNVTQVLNRVLRISQTPEQL